MQYGWWGEEVRDRHTVLVSNLDTIKQAQNNRVFNGVRYDSLYDGIDYLGVASTWGMFDRRPRMPPISLNAVRIVGDTLVSKLVQAETQIEFLTDGGDWAERKKAQLLQKFVSGEFYRLDLYEKATLARMGAVRQGNGYLKFSSEDGKVICEVVHPLEVFADEAETFAGPPRMLIQERFVSRDVLLALYGDDPEKARMIHDAKVVTDSQYHYFTQYVGEIIRVVEGWHLRSGPDEKDGLHIIALDSGSLMEEPWERDTFPFATFRLYPRSRGFYAIGLVERQLEMLLTMNKLLRRKHAAIHLLSAPYFLIEAGSRVVKSHFSTDIGNFIEYLGTKPDLVVNKVVNPDLDAAIPQLLSWMFMDAGINELEAAGQKPEGLDSAPAIAQYSDTSGIRHVSILKENERFFKQCAECILEEVRDIYRRTGKYETFGHFKGYAELIDWSDLDLARDSYVMKLANANTLPQTPAGRVNEVIRMANAGVLNPVQAVRALQSPDIEALTQDLTAPEEDLEWTIYQMTKLKGAKYMPPEPFQDLQNGLIKVNNALLRERDSGAPEEILNNLRRWLADADSLLAEQQAAMMAEQQMQAPAPPPQPLGEASPTPLTTA